MSIRPRAKFASGTAGAIHGLVLSAVREKLLGSDLVPSAVPNPAVFANPSTIPTDRACGKSWRISSNPLCPKHRRRRRTCQLAMPRRTAQSSDPRLLHFLRLNRPAATASPAIQLHNSYLVAESEDGLIIIDQHALHERIMYEDLLARISPRPAGKPAAADSPDAARHRPATGIARADSAAAEPTRGSKPPRSGPALSPFMRFPASFSGSTRSSLLRELLETRRAGSPRPEPGGTAARDSGHDGLQSRRQSRRPAAPRRNRSLAGPAASGRPQQQLPPRPAHHAAPDASRSGKAIQADGVLNHLKTWRLRPPSHPEVVSIVQQKPDHLRGQDRGFYLHHEIDDDHFFAAAELAPDFVERRAWERSWRRECQGRRGRRA